MQEQKIDINLSEEIGQGIYSNLAVITHSNAEFILDFVSIMPGIPKGNVKSRIIMTPQNAKRLLHALAENVKKFEDKNGPIKEINPIDSVPILSGTGGLA